MLRIAAVPRFAQTEQAFRVRIRPDHPPRAVEVVATELAVGSPGQNDGRGGPGDQLRIQARKCARVAGTKRCGATDHRGDAQTKDPTGEPQPAAPRVGWKARATSAWRPRHLPLGEQVHVEVRNGFAGVGAVVNHEAEAGGKVEFFCDDVRDREQVAEDGFVGGRGCGEAWNQLFGDDQQVHGGLRLDVVEDDAEVVFVFDLGGDFAVDDALEDGFHRRGTESE